MGDDSGAVYSLVVSLVLIAGAAVAATFLLKRWRGSVGRHDGPLRLVHVIALGPRERLALVKVGGKYLVIGVTPTSINKISEALDIDEHGGDGARSAIGPQSERASGPVAD
jgi:flagellar protein FliO/FliZ